MKRYHLSNTDELRVDFQSRYQLPEELQSTYSKPTGFWYDADMDWLRWLDDEGYLDNDGWMRPFLYEVSINESKMRIIDTLEAFDIFESEFSVPWPRPGPQDLPQLRELKMTMISWMKVLENYSGLEIAPYLWERRLSWNSNWYYPWDCASGVIWRADALREIKLIATSKVQILEKYRLGCGAKK